MAQDDDPWAPATLTSTSEADDKKPPAVDPWEPKHLSEEEMPGILRSIGHGLGTGLQQSVQTGQVLAGQKPEPIKEGPEAQPYELRDLWPPTRAISKFSYGLAKSSPTLVGGVAGGLAGSYVDPGVGTLVGGAAGAGLGAAWQALGPVFATELKKTPSDPDGAWTRALESAAMSGAGGAASWALFALKVPGVSEGLRRIAFQALGVQPGVAMAEKVAHNIHEGQPATEGLGLAYVQGAANTAIPMVGHAALGRFANTPTAPSLRERADSFMDTTGTDILRDIQMGLTPMAARDATPEARAIAKDFANDVRVARYRWQEVDRYIERNFTPEQRERMWEAADAESVALQMGKPTTGIGLSTLAPHERSAVEMLQRRSQEAWQEATDLGMVKGEGLPSYTPRMFINASDALGPKSLTAIGRNLRTSTAQMRRRSHLTAEETEAAGRAALGPDASIARDIRTLAVATARMEEAIAGRSLINKIKEVGKRTGDETVTEGGTPDGSPYRWFTIDHPSFKTSRPRLVTDQETGKVEPARDQNGNIVFDRVPLYVRSDFEGPLRSVLSTNESAVYRGLMNLKAKTMSVIMYSPIIHNAVEYGRAFPAMPGKVMFGKIYFEGNRAKKDPEMMQEAVQNGLVPIGRRAAMQDITSMMEEPNIKPGRSWTSQVLAFFPGLFSEKAGDAVKRGVDRAGDFWHNTLLWDRVGDLQMGLYSNFRDRLIAEGHDPQTASRTAAHLANRYAGAVPLESMSQAARKFANLALFSRSFTLGNIGAMKDMFVGLPKDVQAQILRDAGPEGLGKIRSFARRKAISIVLMDMALMYASNSILQDAVDRLRGDKTWGEIGQGYLDRLAALLKRTKEHPFEVFAHPAESVSSLTSNYGNEPNRRERVLVGYQADGTAIYARNPFGKIGEEFIGYPSGPFDMVKRKLGTIAKPLWQIASNDEGFGRKVYNPEAKTTGEMLRNIGNIVSTLMGAQVPMDQLKAARDLVQGAGDAKMNTLKLVGPLAGVTFSKGAPGGPALGEYYHAKSRHDYEVQKALPEIRRQIQIGNLDEATARMDQLSIPRRLQRFYIDTTLEPSKRLSKRKLNEFWRYSNEEERERMSRFLSNAKP